MSKEEATQEFMLKLADARINKLVDKNKALSCPLGANTYGEAGF